MATQAFAAPRLLGPLEYGRALVLLTGPFLIQAVLETVLLSLTIQWARRPGDGQRHLRRLWRDALLVAVCGGLISGLIALSGTREWSGGPLAARLLAPAVISLLLAFTTVLMGVAFAASEYTGIVGAFGLASIVLPASVWALRGLGWLGFVLALAVNHVAVASMLISRPSVRRFARTALRTGAGSAGPTRLLEYFVVSTPRLTLLLLSPGLVLIGSLSLSFEQLAVFKVSLSLIGAGVSIVPISQPVLQALWSTPGAAAGATRRDFAVLLTLVSLFAGVVAAGLAHFGGAARGLLLGAALADLRTFDVMFLALPLYALIPLLSAYLLAAERARLLAWAFACTLAVVVLATAVGNVGAAFVAGSAVFVAFVLPLCFWPGGAPTPAMRQPR